MLAEAVYSCLVPGLGLPDRGVKKSNFAVLRETNMPAALVELAFISNHAEEGLLENVAFQQKAALAIAQGICDYLGINLPAPLDPGTARIIVDGQMLTGLIVGGRTYAPVRALAEALGRTVEWDEPSKTVTVK